MFVFIPQSDPVADMYEKQLGVGSMTLFVKKQFAGLSKDIIEFNTKRLLRFFERNLKLQLGA